MKKTNTGPPSAFEKARGRSQPYPSQRSSSTQSYHKRSHTPRGIVSVGSALPAHAWRQLREEVCS